MNKFKSLLMLSIILLMTACSDKNAELINMVPQDAAFVLSINPKNIVSKSGITFKDGKVVFPAFVNPEYAEKMVEGKNDMIKDILNAGIDYETNIIFFTPNIGSDEFTFVARIKDAKAFDEFVKKQNEGVQISKDGDLSYFTNHNSIIAFNDNILYITSKTMMVNEDDQIKSIKDAFGGKIKNLASNKSAVDALAKSNDINVFMNYARLYESIGKSPMINNSMMELISTYSGEYVGSLNFNKDNAEFNGKVIDVKDNKYTKLIAEAIGKPNADFLKLMPDNFDCFLSFSLKGEKLAANEEIQKLINDNVNNPIATNKEILDLIASIDGPVSIGCNSASAYSSGVQGMVTIKTKNPEMLLSLIQKTIDSILMGMPKTQTKNGFSVSAMGITLEYGQIGDFVYLSTAGVPERSAYENDDIKKFFGEMISGIYFDAGKSTSLAAIITQNTGLTINGAFYCGAPKTDENTAKLIITEPKQDNILQTLMYIGTKVYENR